MKDVIMFGVAIDDDGGHFFWHHAGGRMRLDSSMSPWGYGDGTLAPRDAAGNVLAQGHAALIYKDGFTALAFWDRSRDSRPGSNRWFFAHGKFSFDEMMEGIGRDWPEVLTAMPFKIVEAKDPPPHCRFCWELKSRSLSANCEAMPKPNDVRTESFTRGAPQWCPRRSAG